MSFLSQLPKPTFFYELDFETELNKLHGKFISLNPGYETLLLESDPVNKILQTVAYEVVSLKAEFNENFRQCLLTDSTGTNLDNIAANSVTVRLPGESDESLRYRASIAPESFTCAGPSGAYEYHALKVSSDVMHVTVLAHTPKNGYVTLILLSHSNNSEATEELRDAVWHYLTSEEIIPLCDRVHVEQAHFLDLEIKLKATFFEGVDEQEGLQRISQALEYLSELNKEERKAKDVFKPGEMLTINQIHKAARVLGVQNIELISPAEDIQPGIKESIRITARDIQSGGFYE